jgi:AAHS family benzoate transporter-like MFS transporter
VRNRVAIVAATFSGVQIGGLAAAGLGMLLFPRFGWRSVFYLGALPLLLIPVFLKVLPESPAYLFNRGRLPELAASLRRVRPAEALAEDATFAMQKGAGKVPISAIFRDHRAWSTVLICVFFFMNLYMNYGLVIWLPKLMMNAGFSLRSSLSSLLVLQFMAFCGIVGVGYVSERLGNRPVMVTCFLIASVATALLGHTHNFAALVFLAALAGTAAASAQGVANGYGAVYFPPNMRSTGVGLAYASGRFGSIFSLTITGVLVSNQVSLSTTFLAMAIPGVIAAVAVLLVQERYGFAAK